MTQTPQPQQPRSEEISGVLHTNPPSIIDCPSDNDVNEKSAREKFKKTSLASLSKQTIPSQTMYSDETDPSFTDSSILEPIEQSASHSSEIKPSEVPRGRTVGKRAFVEEDASAREGPVAQGQLSYSSNDHARKRSRDVPAGDHLKGTDQPRLSQKESVQEEVEDVADERKPGTVSEKEFKGSLIGATNDGEVKDHLNRTNSVLPHIDDDRAVTLKRTAQILVTDEKMEDEDEMMNEGLYSPRKKRSRDQVDPEAERGQKIAATEGTRAQRRSEELDRAENAPHVGAIGPDLGSGPTAVDPSASRPPNKSQAFSAKSNSPRAAFGATNTLRLLSGSSPSKSPVRVSDVTHAKHEDPSAPTPSAFASSGFASFASSSTSPFGTMSGSSKAASTSAAGIEKSETQAVTSGQTGFGSFASMQPHGFGAAQPSLFAAAGSAGRKNASGTVFGASFGGAVEGISKLKSFAAPTGDVKFGSANDSVNPSKTSNHASEGNGGSESESEREEEQAKEDDISEADDRFQHQDVETGEDGEDTIFSSRAKLYAYKDNNWKEAGNGVFKLNVISSENLEGQQKTSRFIMRAHQTYRVLLNQPVIPQMKIGDRSGNEPTGKAFAFAVIEDGKPIPHMVRVSLAQLYIKMLMLISPVRRHERKQDVVPSSCQTTE